MVKWYDLYADGDIVKDAGEGMIVGVHCHDSVLDSAYEFTKTYEVLRFDGAIQTYPINDIEPIK